MNCMNCMTLSIISYDCNKLILLIFFDIHKIIRHTSLKSNVLKQIAVKNTTVHRKLLPFVIILIQFTLI